VVSLYLRHKNRLSSTKLTKFIKILAVINLETNNLGWMDGWLDRRMDEWLMDGWMDGLIDEWFVGWIGKWMYV
jgi:kynureninase